MVAGDIPGLSGERCSSPNVLGPIDAHQLSAFFVHHTLFPVWCKINRTRLISPRCYWTYWRRIHQALSPVFISSDARWQYIFQSRFSLRIQCLDYAVINFPLSILYRCMALWQKRWPFKTIETPIKSIFLSPLFSISQLSITVHQCWTWYRDIFRFPYASPK